MRGGMGLCWGGGVEYNEFNEDTIDKLEKSSIMYLAAIM